jgi:hypothetical protein
VYDSFVFHKHCARQCPGIWQKNISTAHTTIILQTLNREVLDQINLLFWCLWKYCTMMGKVYRVYVDRHCFYSVQKMNKKCLGGGKTTKTFWRSLTLLYRAFICDIIQLNVYYFSCLIMHTAMKFS